MKRRVTALGVLGSALVSACNVFFSLEDYAAPELSSCSTCAAERCQCVPKAPAGFDHARLRTTASAEDLCPSGTVAGVAMGQGERNTGCECACDSPASGAACGLAIFAGAGCGGSAAKLVGAACTPFGTTGEASALVVPAAGASCPSLALPRPPEFEVAVLACLDQLPGEGGCDDRTTCSASAGAPFDPSACIVAKPGAPATCPDSYSHRYVFRTGFDDQRSCDATACKCAPQQCPDTKVSLCKDAACTDCPKSAEVLAGCTGFGGLVAGRVDVDGKTQGQCSPSGSATVAGTLTATGALVVCCRRALGSG